MCIDLLKIFCDLVSGLPDAKSIEPASKTPSKNSRANCTVSISLIHPSHVDYSPIDLVNSFVLNAPVMHCFWDVLRLVFSLLKRHLWLKLLSIFCAKTSTSSFERLY